MENEKLYVVTCISNPVRYNSRYALYRQFAERMEKNENIEFYTIEQAFGRRPFEITDPTNPHHIQVRSKHELWHKENMLNIAISRLPADWKYVAWIDADINFSRSDWAEETINQLQHYDVVQMFSHATDLGPKYEPLKTHNGFCYSYLNQDQTTARTTNYNSWHSGFAWAITREAFDSLGGLMDISILGSGDRQMAMCLIGQVEETFYPGMMDHCPEYANVLLQWQNRANKFIKKNVGYVSGTILHNWHGKKVDRGYADRWKILLEDNFNPNLDLKKDWQGLYQLTDRSISLRDDVRAYFRSRNEDSIDL